MSGIPAGAGSLLGKRLGKYEILALLALGGTAEIYLARIGGAAGFEKYVVVKCLHDHLADDTDFVKMFLDEARLAAHLDHSNIVQTMELGEHENRYYMVMEFLAGLSLAMIIRRGSERLANGRLPVPLALNIVAQACAGLHYAHDKAANGKPLNIVHRDISPQNLVISFEGVVKVVDFGIAKAELRETRTRSGTIKGKFAYMSPEQCVANNVDRRSDVFALGVIAHELLTGKRLFKKPSPYETYQAVLECAVAKPSSQNVELDPAIDDVIMPAVAKDREARYQSAEAFGDALLGYLHHRGKGSGPSDVARFFDATFAQEIDEHGARMRELISGRDAAESGVGWGADDDRDRGGEPDVGGTVDLGPRGKVETLDTADLVEASASGLSDVISGLAPSGEDEDLPSDRTRIEANPLERFEALGVPPRPTPLPPKLPERPSLPPSGALPLPAPPTGPVPAAPRRVSEIVNSPTQLAPEAAWANAERGRPELAATQVAPPVASPMPPRPSAPPMDYPVMSREMREQIATGATVFPSESRPSQASVPPPPQAPPDSSGYPPFPRAGDVVSPVGPGYGENVDWAGLAAMPAKAIPPWKLALLFVGALGIALGITLVIALIAR